MELNWYLATFAFPIWYLFWQNKPSQNKNVIIERTVNPRESIHRLKTRHQSKSVVRKKVISLFLFLTWFPKVNAGGWGGGGDKAFKKLKFFLVSHNAFKCKSQTDYPMNLSHFPQLTTPQIWMKIFTESFSWRILLKFAPLFYLPPFSTS